MPATRSSAVAGPSRIPYTPPVTRRRTIADPSSRRPAEEDGDIEEDYDHFNDPPLPLPSGSAAPSPNRLTSRARSVSFQPSELETSTPRPRSAQHKRRGSGGSQSHHSHQSIFLSPPSKPRTSQVRPAVRHSLTGSTVLGMNVNDRAEVLADVAGDCLVTLVKASFAADKGKQRRRSGPEDEVTKAWEGLYALRHSYFFPTHSSPFPLFADVLESLHSQIRASLDPIYLNRAVGLSNIATFVYTILRSEDAGDLLKPQDVEESEEDINYEAMRNRRKGKGKMPQVDPAFLKRVERRNEILLSAWKRFWQVVVPLSKRSSESALRLWLDFSTQLVLTYQVPVVGTDMYHESSLPGPPPTLVQNLFSPSAVGRYGQWDITQDWDSQAVDGEKRNVEERWSTMARKRLDEIHSSQLVDLLRKYPYDIFRQEMVAYLQHEVLASPANPMLTPIRRRLLIGSSPHQQPSPSVKKRGRSMIGHSSSDEDMGNDETELADWSSEHESYTEDQQEEEEAGEEDDASIDLDFARQMALELEGEAKQSPEGNPRSRSRSRSDSEADAMPSNEDEDPPGNMPESALTEDPGPDLSPEGGQANDEEDTWAVRNYVSPRTSASPSNYPTNGEPAVQKPKFDWTARQHDAVQIEWDSQSLEGIGGRERLTEGEENEDSGAEDWSPLDDDQHGSLPVVAGSSGSAITERLSQDRQQEKDASNESHLQGNAPMSHSRQMSPRARDPSAPTANHSPPPLRALQDSSTPRKAGPSTTIRRKAFVALSDEEEDEEIEGALPRLREQTSEHTAPAAGEVRPSAILDEGDEDEFGDLLPSEEEFSRIVEDSIPERDDREDVLLADLPPDGPLDDPVQQRSFDIADNAYDDIALSRARIVVRQLNPVLPTSQTAYISPRARRRTEPHDFIPPDENEDLQDRDLLQRSASLILGPSASRVGSQSAKSEPLSPVIMNVNNFVRRNSKPPLKKQPGVPVLGIRHRDEVDPFLHDQDGSPLDPDELYVIPDDYSEPKSKIHGRVNQSASTYCRLSGPRKWTGEEELLLYRTVQKVPAGEQYPLQVVKALHGEYGMLSHKLKWFNTQHMKDKMRTTVQRRINQGRLVVGRARAWAKDGSKERREYNWEREEIRKALLVDEEEAKEEENDDDDEGVAEDGPDNEDQEGDENGVDGNDEDDGREDEGHENEGQDQDDAVNGNGNGNGNASEEQEGGGLEKAEEENQERTTVVREKASGTNNSGIMHRKKAARKSTSRNRQTPTVEETPPRRSTRQKRSEQSRVSGRDASDISGGGEERSDVSSVEVADDGDDFPEPSSFRLDDANPAENDHDMFDGEEPARRTTPIDVQTKLKSSKQVAPNLRPAARRGGQSNSEVANKTFQSGGSRTARSDRAEGRARKRTLAESSGAEDPSGDDEIRRPVKRATRSTSSRGHSPEQDREREFMIAVEIPARHGRQIPTNSSADDNPPKENEAGSARSTPASVYEEGKDDDAELPPPRRGRGKMKGFKGRKGKGKVEGPDSETQATSGLNRGPRTRSTAAKINHHDRGGEDQDDSEDGVLFPSPTPTKVLVPSSSARMRNGGSGTDSDDDGDAVDDEAEAEIEEGHGQRHAEVEANTGINGSGSASERVAMVPDTYDEQAAKANQVNVNLMEGEGDANHNHDTNQQVNDNDNGNDNDNNGVMSIYDGNDDEDDEQGNQGKDGFRLATPTISKPTARSKEAVAYNDDDDEFSERNRAKRRAAIARKVRGL
ncbi:hypothetical protein IAT40_000623 [Kwoniella sp. CBS 6097]